MIESLVMLIVWLVVLGLVAWLAYWLLGRVPIPEPFRTVLYVVLALVFFLLVVYLVLLPLARGAGLP